MCYTNSTLLTNCIDMMADKVEVELHDEVRSRTFTEKGLEYALEMKAIRLRGLVKTLRRSTEELQILLADTHTDIADMQHEYYLWVASFEELLTVNEDVCTLLSPTSQDQHLLDFDRKKQQFLAVKVLVEDWFATKEISCY